MIRLFAVFPVEEVISPIATSAVGSIGSDEEPEAAREVSEFVRRRCVNPVVDALFVGSKHAGKVDVNPVSPIPARVLKDRFIRGLSF